MISTDLLLGPGLKLLRADDHIRELIRTTEPLDSHLYEIRQICRTIPPSTEPNHFQLAYWPTEPIPEILSIIIGDAIHSLRAALDHLASGIIRTADPSAKPYFPISKDRDSLASSGSLKQMEAALPGSTRILTEKIRPAGNARDHLWSALGSLDIDDKHNLVIPTITLGTLTGFDANFDEIGSFRKNVIRNNAAKPIYLISSRKPIIIEGKPIVSVRVKFGGGTPLDGYLVVQTLIEFRNLVAETVQAFAELIGCVPNFAVQPGSDSLEGSEAQGTSMSDENDHIG
jgi:hypothetical protein